MSRTAYRDPSPAAAGDATPSRRPGPSATLLLLAAAALGLGLGGQLEAQPAPGRGPVSPFSIAARLTVPDHVTGTAGQLLYVRALSPAKVFVWLPGTEGLEVFTAAPGVDQSQCAVKAAAAGTYRLWCTAVLNDRTATGLVTVTITGGTPTPPTPTPPTPTPTPPTPTPPTPTPPDPKPPEPKPPADAGPLWAVVIETPLGSANRGQMFTDPTLTAYAKIKGHRFRVVDKNVVGADGKPPPDLAPYLKMAEGAALPQLYLVTERGRVLYRGTLPETPDALLGLIKKVGG
jgi:hypothetical protein